jgi:hypothetical protein
MTRNLPQSRAPPESATGLRLARQLCMPSSLRRSLPITGAAVLITAALTDATPAPRVRPETPHAAALLADLVQRSPTARDLASALEQSDVVVYVRHRVFAGSTLNGRIGFVRSAMPTRFLIIEIGCPRSRLEQLVTLGHELQHAAELAADPTVADPRAMTRYFERIGTRTRVALATGATFETAAAQAVETRVRQELLGEKPTRRTAVSRGLERHNHDRP